MKRLLALSVMLLVVACDDINVHILSGQLYEPQNACLEPSTGIDVVNGGSTGDSCDPVCLSVTSGGTTSTYITTMCPPYPGDYGDAEAQDATNGASDPCTGAFAAYDSEGGLCPPTLDEGGALEASTDAGDGAAPGDDGSPAGDDGSSATDTGSQDAEGDAGTSD